MKEEEDGDAFFFFQSLLVFITGDNPIMSLCLFFGPHGYCLTWEELLAFISMVYLTAARSVSDTLNILCGSIKRGLDDARRSTLDSGVGERVHLSCCCWEIERDLPIWTRVSIWGGHSMTPVG